MRYHSRYSTVENAWMHWFECCSALHYWIPFCLHWSRGLQHHHDIWWNVPWAAVDKTDTSWYCSRIILQSYIRLHIFSNVCMYMQYVFCNIVEYIKLILWSWQRCFYIYFISWVSDTFLWMWLVMPGFCQGTFTIFLMTTVYL